MKKVSMRIAMAALLIAVGTLGLNAQNGNRGNGQGTGTCICGTGTCTTQLTDEQKLILEELCDAFQAEMAVLRTDLQAAVSVSDKLAIRQEMVDLRDAHLAEVKALLASWGVTVSPGCKKGGALKGAGNMLQSLNGTGICDGTGVGTGTGKQYRKGKN